MRSSFRWTAAVAALTLGCGGLPPIAPLDQEVADIDFGVITCPDAEPLGTAIPVGLTCTMTVQATDTNGIPIANPDLVWSSSNTSILAASGSGSTGTLTGRITGQAILTVRDTRNQARATVRINVVRRV